MQLIAYLEENGFEEEALDALSLMSDELKKDKAVVLTFIAGR